MSTEILTIKMPIGWVAWVPDLFQSIEFETEHAAIENAARWMQGNRGDKIEQFVELYAANLESCVTWCNRIPGTKYFVHVLGNQFAVELSFADDKYREARPKFEGKENANCKIIEFEQTRVLVYGTRNSSWSYAAMKADADSIGEQILLKYYEGYPPQPSEYDRWHPMADVAKMYLTEHYAQYYQHLQRIRHDHE